MKTTETFERRCCIVAAISLVLLVAVLPTINGQGTTGQISGTVVDPGGAIIAGATVQLTSDLTKQVREYKTEGNGTFVFTSLIPGNFSIVISHPGFKAYSQQGINVATAERVSLSEIKLEVGQLTTTVTVEAQTARVATDTSDQTALITTIQVENTPIRGRDYLGLLRTMPGVIDTLTHDRPGAESNSIPTVNGGQMGQFLIMLDGVLNADPGWPQVNGWLAPSVDAISEVKVMTGNFLAESGSRSGGQMNVAIKSGNAQFHGSAYYFWRHEMFNANEWFNNKNGQPKPRYRFQNPGGTIGGPVLIPWTNFNKSRTKLFFFFSEDYLRYFTASSTARFAMPTALERNGDYSKTERFDSPTQSWIQIPVKDPTTQAPFPLNKIPADRFDPAGWFLLSYFPLPDANKVDPTGLRQYNNWWQYRRGQPREDRILRVDYNLGSKTTMFARLMQDFTGDQGIGSDLSGTGTWGQLATDYNVTSAGYMATVVHMFRPTLINELTLGLIHARQKVQPEDTSGAQWQRNTLAAIKGPDGKPVTMPNVFGINSMNLIPKVSFGASGATSAGQAIVGTAPSIGWDSRFPLQGTDNTLNFTNNISWIKGSHNTKFGVYMEHTRRWIRVYDTYGPMGQYYFGTDTANPYDTGYGYSNLLMGSVQAYGEDNKIVYGNNRLTQLEWFAQDSWKIARRVTLDLGVRFQWIGTITDEGKLGLFTAPYDAGKMGVMLKPALVGGKKVAINPQTGATYAYARRNSFDPLSYDSKIGPYSGMRTYDGRFFNSPMPVPGPRVGFAWDVFGNGKTAVRGGFGMYFARAYALAGGVDRINQLQKAPPSFQAQIAYNTTIPQLLSATAYLSPQAVNGGSQDAPAMTTLSWSFGIQRDVGRGMVLDVSYVANTTRHGFGTTDINAIAPYTNWNPVTGVNKALLDPTATTAFLDSRFYRPILGYTNINVWSSPYNTNYNSLQVQLNRRFGKRLQFGSNYTWAKTLSYSRQRWVDDKLTYNVSGRPHAFNLYGMYLIPDGSRVWKSFLTKSLLDGWHVNGIATVYYGTPLTVGCSVVSAPIGWPTGTPTGGVPFRCQMSGNLWLAPGYTVPSTSEPRLYYPLNMPGFTLPSDTSLGIGNTPPTLFYGPGRENIDLTLFKDFRLGKENRVLEFRAELYNALNHMSPSNPSTSLTIDYATRANTNAAFGTITGSQSQARRVVVALKFRF